MLDELLADHRTGQDETQLGTFVLGGRTPWGTYKQALRELYKRIRGLRQMFTDRDLLHVDMDELEGIMRDNPWPDGGWKARRAGIRLRQKHGVLEELERRICDTTREAALFYCVAKELKEKFGEVNDIERWELDREEWKWWHLKRVACLGADEVVKENLISLPTEERKAWLAILSDQEKMDAVLNASEYGRWELPVPTNEDLKLIEEAASK